MGSLTPWTPSLTECPRRYCPGPEPELGENLTPGAITGRGRDSGVLEYWNPGVPRETWGSLTQHLGPLLVEEETLGFLNIGTLGSQ